ncbi:hypothetical protein NFI96_001306 [Prochilodus magdalenae]|nr:hypothetical protein NFI96_001306 [Prochilodus magdalenae]
MDLCAHGVTLILCAHANARFDAHPPPGHRQVGGYRNWNPPLLGNLPDDFLRILPQQLDSLQRSQSSLSQPSSSSSSLSSLTQYSAASGSGPAPGGSGWASEQDRKLKQYLEDERIALFLQNEEFMRELQRNRDFLIALERDRQRYESLKSQGYHSSACMERCAEGDHCASGSEEACTSVSDDALFRDKLKHMGKFPADGAVGVEVEGHRAFWTCDNKPFILVLTTVPPHTDSLGVSTKTKVGLITEDDPLPFCVTP